MEYPVFEFERKPKGRRRRRIAVVSGQDSSVWWPQTVDYSSRVKLDSGTVEAILCVNQVITELS
ncbi:MAG: hypothetical protein DRQ78_04690 [Epsilonproteobacteria bacterium]|nr:MAG: hypothetical protein DRQ78_04690 [Campylobacterota bacterium]